MTNLFGSCLLVFATLFASIESSRFDPYPLLDDLQEEEKYFDQDNPDVYRETDFEPLRSPNTRSVSIELATEYSNFQKQQKTQVNMFAILFGQFVTHDITLGEVVSFSEMKTRYFSDLVQNPVKANITWNVEPTLFPPPSTLTVLGKKIEIFSNDPVFERSVPNVKSKLSLQPSNFVNNKLRNIVTPALDLSVVYGSEKNVSDLLRKFKDGLLLVDNSTGLYERRFNPLFYPRCENCTDLFGNPLPNAFSPPPSRLFPTVPTGPDSCPMIGCVPFQPVGFCKPSSYDYSTEYYQPTREYLPTLAQFGEAGKIALNEVVLQSFLSLNQKEFFLAGDARAIDNIGLNAIHTIFLNNHNRIARALKISHQNDTDEEIYQNARRLNIVQYQKIVYESFLPTVLSKKYAPFNGNTKGEYDAVKNIFLRNYPTQNSLKTFEVSSVNILRWHTLLANNITLFDPVTGERRNRDPTRVPTISHLSGPLNPADDQPFEFFPMTGQIVSQQSAKEMYTHAKGLEGVIYSHMKEKASSWDTRIQPTLQGLLLRAKCFFENPQIVDIPVLSLERARELKIKDYVKYRREYTGDDIYSLPQCSITDEEDDLFCFRRFVSDLKLAEDLKRIYKKVNAVDLLIALHSEKPGSEGSIFGPTASRMISHQFVRTAVMDDRFYVNQDPTIVQDPLVLSAKEFFKTLLPEIQAEDFVRVENPFLYF